jgi:hypothetical protein
MFVEERVGVKGRLGEARKEIGVSRSFNGIMCPNSSSKQFKGPAHFAGDKRPRAGAENVSPNRALFPCDTNKNKKKLNFGLAKKK